MTNSPRHRWYLRPIWMSLAVLLVVVAAIAASIRSYAWRRVATLAWVERLGGQVEFAPLPDWIPEWLDEYWPDWARRIDDLEMTPPPGEDLKQLPVFREAKTVTLWGPVDSQIRPLSSFYRLEVLALRDPEVTDAGMAPLSRCRRLRQLFLDYSGRDEDERRSIGDDGLKHLVGLPLEQLYLWDAQVTDVGVGTLCQPRLRVLALRRAPITDAGLEKLKSLPLESLFLDGTGVTDAGLKSLGGMSRLEVIDLSRTQITDAGLSVLATWPRLNHLELNETRITNAGLVYLSKMRLRQLALSNTAIDDDGLKHLQSLTTLTILSLTDTKCTRSGASELAKSLGLNPAPNPLTLLRSR
jgi:hypothetical protein